MAKKKFKLAGSKENCTDETGTVRIAIVLADPNRAGRNLKGNITEYFSIKQTKVSEVTKAMKLALFGEE